MSYRPPRNTRSGKPAPMRGPSRPVDPRNRRAYYPVKRGPDPFAMSLLAVVAVGVVVLLILVLLQNKGSTPPTTTTNQPLPGMTQTMIAFETQTSPDSVPRISLADAKALYDANNIKMIDVREANVYAVGHIKGAVNIPQNEVQTRLSEIPKTGNVVLYCQ